MGFQILRVLISFINMLTQWAGDGRGSPRLVQFGFGNKCLLTLSTSKNFISMNWKVVIQLSPSFKTLATPITEEMSSHYEQVLV